MDGWIRSADWICLFSGLKVRIGGIDMDISGSESAEYSIIAELGLFKAMLSLKEAELELFSGSIQGGY